jgi:Domain of unknown function DUF11
MGLSRGGLRRFGAGAVAAFATISSLGLATTAYAEETGGADLAVSVASTTVVKEAGKPFLVRLHNNGPATAVGIELTIDATGLDSKKLDVQLPDTGSGCVADTPTKVRCVLPDLPPGGNDNGIDGNGIHGVFVQSLGGTGAAGSFTVSVRSQTTDPDATNNTATTNVTVAKSGIDMTAWAQDVYAVLDTNKPIKPGKTGEFQWLLYNSGAKSVKDITFTITLPVYLDFASKQPGCTYRQDEATRRVADCSTGNGDIIPPGGAITFGDAEGNAVPTKVRLAANAPGPAVITAGTVSGHGGTEVKDAPNPAALRPLAQSPGYKVLSAPDADKVRKVAEPKAKKDADPNDNVAPFSAYTAANPADLSVSAAPVEGHVGDTVPATVTVSNAGPGDALDAKVKVTAPGGTEITPAGSTCTATTAGKEYVCGVGFAPVGGHESLVFQVKILSAALTDGKAEVSSSSEDTKPDNNSTAIKVTITTGTGGSGGGSGSLPITGSRAGLIGGLGLGAIAVGAVLLLLTRRRRGAHVPPVD